MVSLETTLQESPSSPTSTDSLARDPVSVGRRSSIAPPSIPDLVCRELRRLISVGDLRPGPLRISKLAEEFGVSPVPVREALRRLEAEGFVTFEHNRRVRVNSLSLEDLREVYLIREALEVMLVSQAVPLATRDRAALEEMERQIEIMDHSMEQPAAWGDANAAFHWALYSLAPLPRLKTTVQSLWTAVEAFLRIYATSTDQLRVAQAQHRELLGCIRAGAVEPAVVVLRQHLTDTIRSIEIRLDQLSTSDEAP